MMTGMTQRVAGDPVHQARDDGRTIHGTYASSASVTHGRRPIPHPTRPVGDAPETPRWSCEGFLPFLRARRERGDERDALTTQAFSREARGCAARGGD